MKNIGCVEGRNFYLLDDWNSGNLRINVTDLRTLWKEVLTEEEAQQKFKTQNPLVQSAPQKVKEIISSLLSESAAYEFQEEGDLLNLTSTKKIGPVKIKLNITLSKRSQEDFYNEVTLPLVILINQLNEQQNSLYSQLKEKDLELEEYKLEGAEITRRNVRTEKFEETVFQNKWAEEFVNKVPPEISEVKLNLNLGLLKIFSETCRHIPKIFDVQDQSLKHEPIENEVNITQQEDIQNDVSPQNEKGNQVEIKVESQMKVEMKRAAEEIVPITRKKKPKKNYAL